MSKRRRLCAYVNKFTLTSTALTALVERGCEELLLPLLEDNKISAKIQLRLAEIG